MTDQEKKVEPTEEQKQAALSLFDEPAFRPYDEEVARIARLLAKREAKLQDRCVRIGVDVGRDERDALQLENENLRARVAELREEHQKQLVEFNDIVARAITRAVDGLDEWAMGDDVLRPALQKVIDAKIATITARYKHQHEVDTLRARVAALTNEVALVQSEKLAIVMGTSVVDADGEEAALIAALRAEVVRLEAKLSRPQLLGTVLLDENEALRARVVELERIDTAHYDDAKAEGGKQ